MDETWEFLEGPLLNVLYEELPDDAHLISKPRLRIQKMKKDSCKTKNILKDKFSDCYGSYDPTFEMTEELEGVSGTGQYY